jgi:uncharacterized membrane protein YkoI
MNPFRAKQGLKILVPAALVGAMGAFAVEGTQVPMSAAIQNALERYPDLYLANAELDRERERMVYEIELAGRDGKKREIHIDAANGELVREHEEYDDDYDGMGELKSFPSLMTSLKAAGHEDVREVELDRERGRWVYEIRAAGADGATQRMFLDATTGETLEGNWDD